MVGIHHDKRVKVQNGRVNFNSQNEKISVYCPECHPWVQLCSVLWEEMKM